MRIFYCNNISELYLSSTKEELINKNFFKFIQPSEEIQAELEEVILNVLNYDLSEIKEFKFINSTGQKTWVEMFFTPVEFKVRKLVQIIIYDITEKKYAEKIIKNENKKLRELNQIRKKLTAKTSEELKNPLSVMSNASNILLKTYKDKLDQSAVELLELIKSGGKRSMDLVSKMVDISRIESFNFKLNKQIESITEILRNTVEFLVENLNSNVKFNLDCPNDFFSEVDILRMEQVFKDLLLLMIKNTSKDTISIFLKKVDNFAEITFYCTNNIFNEKTKKRFFLGKPKKGAKDVTMGVHYAKEVIELHGGEILIKMDKVQKSTKFIIRLPLKDWTENLVHLFVFYESGILLHDHKFQEQITLDSVLISGSLIGLSILLKEIFQSKGQHLKVIDNGDLKIIFKRNRTKKITFALVVKRNLHIIHGILNSLISEFDEKHKHLIDDIENTAHELDNWQDIGIIIQKYFGNTPNI